MSVDVLAILQARMTSNRLPGKVLKPIVGKPMMIHQLERVARARAIDRIVVATSTDPSDDAIVTTCAAHRFEAYRGALDDVLDRFYGAAQKYAPQHVVRLTADCPLADPAIIDSLIAFHRNGGFDYSSNARIPTYPDGLDVEVFTFAALRQAWSEATLPSDREHVTPFLSESPERFSVGDYTDETDRSHLRWTVDKAADFELISRIYNALYPTKPDFTTADVLALLNEHPDWSELNAGFKRNESYVRVRK